MGFSLSWFGPPVTAAYLLFDLPWIQFGGILAPSIIAESASIEKGY